MGKPSPKLTLVGKDSDNSVERGLGIAEGLQFVAVNELSLSEERRIERLLKAVSPRAGVIAVALTSRPWDNRPVVVLADEDGPSIIRSVGPDVASLPALGGKVRDVLERISRFQELSCHLQDWGVFEEQVWYRRSLVAATAGHRFLSQEAIAFNQVEIFVDALIDQISDWHSRGVVHAHLTTSNVVFTGKEVSLLDPAIGAAIVRSTNRIVGLDDQLFAPEILTNGDYDYSADIFGLGQILRRLLVVIRKQHQLSEMRPMVKESVEPYFPLIESMLDADPEKRPTLSEIRAFQKKMRKGRNDTSKPTTQAGTDPKRRVTGQGKLIKPSEQDIEDRTGEGLSRRPGYSGGPDAQTTIYQVMSGREAGRSTVSIDESDISRPQRENFLARARKNRDRQISDELTDWNDGRETEEMISFAPEKEAQSWTWVIVVGCILLSFLVYYRVIRQSDESGPYSREQLIVLWESRVPSKMVRVAELAVDPDQQENFAEDLIIRSANKGEQLPGVIDSSLMRIAFNARWEMELSPTDRRMALALALSGLLRNEMPKDLGPLEARHPGVILAVTASAGENAKRFLKNIPADTLTKLPPPFGPAFQKLLQGTNQLSCADPAVVMFARLSTHGVERSKDLPAFLAQNTEQHLQALALMFSTQNELAKQVLDVLLNHPNMILDIDQIRWGREWKLTEWKELEAADQLFVLAGVPPSAIVSVENVGKLFMHPSPSLRVYAIDQALDRIKFGHPGTYEAMQLVRRKPDILSPEQLFKLAELLENPSKATEERVQKWLQSGPAIEVVSSLLLSTATSRQASPIDTWFAVYLKGKNWEGDVVAFRKLASHPDDFTRLFAYEQIFKMKDEEIARTFLKAALGREKKEEYRSQLQQMISQLSS